ncbi:hypothetical protein K402DRAFT_60887 [Aulographum hederae CBS 113979]|uniref:Uncharacterized protein n=1 Tax=Aulographum hederae CBS 113979 TaxID=1176131 RepID=A0A6G1H1R8_9PEZI|nr:hypothetical protein K402DRAFT_60887 [Aulographum hederae CBS 113979]
MSESTRLRGETSKLRECSQRAVRLSVRVEKWPAREEVRIIEGGGGRGVREAVELWGRDPASCRQMWAGAKTAGRTMTTCGSLKGDEGSLLQNDFSALSQSAKTANIRAMFSLVSCRYDIILIRVSSSISSLALADMLSDSPRWAESRSRLCSARKRPADAGRWTLFPALLPPTHFNNPHPVSP